MSTTPLSIAQRLGLQPIDTPRKPRINLKTPNITKLATSIIQNIPPHTLFHREESYFTCTRAAQPAKLGHFPPQVRTMTPDRLCSWLEQWLHFADGADEDAKPSALTKQAAARILASDVFYDATAELDLIAEVRLPIWGEPVDGKRSIILSPPGYNAANRTLTVETLNYTNSFTQMEPAQIRAAFDSIMRHFPWAPEQPYENRTIWKVDATTYHTGPQPSKNRSASVLLALMLGQFCRLMVNRLPMAIINGNQPGTGKSLLAWFLIAPVWGMAASAIKPKSDEELDKYLNTVTQAGKPFALLDDINTLASNAINMVATAPLIEGRKMGTDQLFTTTNRTQIITTGNALATTPDIERRSMIVDLFFDEAATDRSIPTPLAPQDLAESSMRADLLQMLWSLVKNWSDAGCPTLVDGDKSKASYEDFAEVVGSILLFNDFYNPFAKRTISHSGGDMRGKAMESLLTKLADLMNEETHTYDLADVIKTAETHGYLEILCSGKDARRSLGRQLSKLRGRKFKNSKGVPFIFGADKDAYSSKYTFTYNINI